MFTWFGPEPSEFDRRLVERLNRRSIVDDAFVAAALAVDVETPLFSDARASLLRHIPESVTAPAAAEEDFLALLQSVDPMAELDERVQDYLSRTQTLLADPATREAHLRELFDRLLVNRETSRTSDVSVRLNEFPGLLPNN